MKLTEKDIKKIIDIYNSKGICNVCNCDTCIFHMPKEICYITDIYEKARIIIENNPELFMEYLL